MIKQNEEIEICCASILHLIDKNFEPFKLIRQIIEANLKLLTFRSFLCKFLPCLKKLSFEWSPSLS